MTPRVIPDPPVSEAAWMKHVTELATDQGWRFCHTYRGRTSKGAWRTNTTTVGWPDLVMYRPGELIFVELKSDRGELSLAQRAVLDDLRDAGAEVHVWAPRDVWEVTRRLAR